MTRGRPILRRPRQSLALVAEADGTSRRTAYPLTIRGRGCVSASNDTWMRPVHPVTENGALSYVVEDGAA